MARLHYIEITFKRQLAVDAHYQCPRCGFASPVRVWGTAEAKKTVTSPPGLFTNSQPVREHAAAVRAEGKREAEARAVEYATKTYQSIACPRCAPGQQNPYVQFAVRCPRCNNPRLISRTRATTASRTILDRISPAIRATRSA